MELMVMLMKIRNNAADAPQVVLPTMVRIGIGVKPDKQAEHRGVFHDS